MIHELTWRSWLITTICRNLNRLLKHFCELILVIFSYFSSFIFVGDIFESLVELRENSFIRIEVVYLKILFNLAKIPSLNYLIFCLILLFDYLVFQRMSSYMQFFFISLHLADKQLSQEKHHLFYLQVLDLFTIIVLALYLRELVYSSLLFGESLCFYRIINLSKVLSLLPVWFSYMNFIFQAL